MNTPGSLDPDLLRSFTYIAEEGSFTRAAERVGRTQSAVSMQMQRLESLLGQTQLQRGKGGAVQLTAHGQFLLERAREMLALNDGIWSAFRTPEVRGRVRLGTPDDYALRYVPPALKRFADANPACEVDVLCLPSDELVLKLKAGELDLALVSQGQQPKGWPGVGLWRGPLVWITSERFSPHRMDPLPLALAQGPCSWRTVALAALDKAGRRYRVAYTSASQVGSHAPVMAGLAVTVSPVSWLPQGLRALRPEDGLPPLPEFGIVMLQGRKPAQPVTDMLAAHITETFNQEMGNQEMGRAERNAA
jgi:DNA-binding transcriptional LysR family regulator